MIQTRLSISPTGHWIEIRDGDIDVRQIYNRHYSRRRYADGRQPRKVVGPGEYCLLVTAQLDAIFAWRKFISMDRQEGVNCAIFRNEGELLSSMLILEAEIWALERWGPGRVYTYVNPKKVRSSNPGCCFKKAGWRVCGKTKRGLIILEKMI